MIPSPSDPCWNRALSSDSDLSSASLATRILVSRLRREFRAAPADASRHIAELHKFFEKSSFAVKDIALF